MTSFKKILVNGQEVDPANLQNLPEAVQQVLADKNANGIPDIMEGLFDNPLVQKAMAKAGYTSFDQIPPELRETLQGLMQKLGGQAPAGNTQMHNLPSGPGKAILDSSASIDWRHAGSSDQPGMIPVKVIFFALAAILGLAIFAFTAWMFFFEK